MTKVGLYAIGPSTTLESNKSHRWLQVHRGMSFEQLRDALLAEGLLDILGPSDPARYS